MNGSEPEGTVRQAELSDCLRAEAVLSAFGMGVAAKAEDVPRWWDWIWTRNPARMPGRHHPPPGWLLEVDGEIQGFFGNIPARYRLGDEILVTSIASHWAVQTAYRKRSRDLCAAWFSQTEPELLLVSTGVEATGRIFLRNGANPMPFDDYRKVLFWVLDASAFVASVLRRRGASQFAARWAGMAVSPALDGVAALRRRRPGRLRSGLEPDVIPLESVGDEFDDLWLRKLAEGRRLLAYREAADLRWHFEPRPDAVRVLRCRRAGRLEGYLVLLREHLQEIGLVRLKIVDFVAAGDDPLVVDALLAAACELSHELGGHVLELVGFPQGIRSQVSTSRPFSRLYPVPPFFYKALSKPLHHELESQALWYPSLFDGDGCLAAL